MMSSQSSTSVQIAIAGHTNVGKTSLIRSLTRRRDFGQVSSRPATTRHVERADLSVAGAVLVSLFDTPGLEDSSGLLAQLEAARPAHDGNWGDALDAFCDQPHPDFAQEAKALRQMRASDVILYVVDTRDPVLAKHRDELEILGRTGRPVIPVLNFTGSGEARPDQWRAQMARVNMHAVARFDTVLFDEADEADLWRKIGLLAEDYQDPLSRLADALTVDRQSRHRGGAELVADMLIDIAAARIAVKADDQKALEKAGARLRDWVRRRESLMVTELLDLLAHAPDAYLPKSLDVKHSEWSEDPFDPEVLAYYGIRHSGAAAAGAGAGLVLDLMVGGISLGAATLLGAGAGAALDIARQHGDRLSSLFGGDRRLMVDAASLSLLILRNRALLHGLMRRGHGAVDPVTIKHQGGEAGPILRKLAAGRRQPGWSSVTNGQPQAHGARADLVTAIADLLVTPDA